MARCTAVGRANPNFRHVCTSGGQRPKSANVVVMEDDKDNDGNKGCGEGPAILWRLRLLLPLLWSDSPLRDALLSAAARFRLALVRKRLDIVSCRCFRSFVVQVG